ncbi:GCG_CRPN prefix-to-repeats domain-containing protein [Bradyrhizobium sp. USDA 4454]
MRGCLLAILTAAALFGWAPAKAADGCGVGCHATVNGACVIDGWGTGARVWNECPATSRPRPPCGGHGFVWRRDFKACAQTTKDWL